ncbi:MAG: hypothetical protein Q4A74_07695 [Cardiobacteriaceae bacterium]|nr:hypothetical protein [Cardiobacteriaceae bacterium]
MRKRKKRWLRAGFSEETFLEMEKMERKEIEEFKEMYSRREPMNTKVNTNSEDETIERKYIENIQDKLNKSGLIDFELGRIKLYSIIFIIILGLNIAFSLILAIVAINIRDIPVLYNSDFVNHIANMIDDDYIIINY